MNHMSTWLSPRPLSVFCNPEPAEASSLGGRQHRTSVVCFLWCPATKTLLPEHPRVPMRSALRHGTGSLKHLYSRLAPLGDACFLPKPRHNSSGVGNGALLRQDRYTTMPLTLIGAAWWNIEKLSALWDSSAVSPELYKIETDLRLS